MNIQIEATGIIQRADQRTGEKDGKPWEINTAELVTNDKGFVEMYAFESNKDLRPYNGKQCKMTLKVTAKRTLKDAELVLKVVSLEVVPGKRSEAQAG